MDIKINSRLAFIQNRCQICLYEKYKSLRNLQDFSWQSISKINCYTNDAQVCSICFDEPMLPRMDRCGHVFCLSCILNLFEHTESKLVLCPMCKDIDIDLNSLKRVVFLKHEVPKIGNTVKLSLLVKSKESVCPRFADKLSNFRDHVIPRKESSISKFLNVVVERDFSVGETIKRDIRLLKPKSLKIKIGNKTLEHTLLHLNSELEQFKNEIKITEKSIVEAGSSLSNCEEKFNLLEYDKMKDKYKLFYQCGDYNFVYLDNEIQEKMFQGAHDTKQVIPVYIKSEITDMRTETVDNEFLHRTQMKHLFKGAKVTYLTIDLNKSLLGLINKLDLKELCCHQEKLFKEEKEEEELRQRIAKRAAERRNLLPPRRVLTVSTCQNIVGGLQDNINNGPRKFENIVEGFNTCTLGIECLVPDDDYPHAETCIYYTKDKINSSISSENDTEEKYLGLLRLKLNVFHPDQAYDAVDKSVAECDEKHDHNYPPEMIPLEEFPVLNDLKLEPYIVAPKPKTQYQRKKFKKLNEKFTKLSC